MPPALACKFTVAELAVLRIIADEVRDRGCCDRTLAELAARAGCSRTKAQDAIREAARLGLLTVQERRRQGQPNLPNVLRIVSREWLQWIERRPRSKGASRGEGRGFRNSDPTDNKQEKKARPIGRKGLPSKEGAGYTRLEPFPTRMGRRGSRQ
jgi:Mg-chelatase subunit ChlI